MRVRERLSQQLPCTANVYRGSIRKAFVSRLCFHGHVNDEKRICQYCFRLSESERETIREKARRLGLPVSQFLRMTVLGAQTAH